MIVCLLNARKAETMSVVRQRQPTIYALIFMIRITGEHATKEHRERLCWTSPRREIDELKDFVVATLQSSHQFDATKQRVDVFVES